MRPNRVVLAAYLFRGARFWLAVRALIATAFLLGGISPVRLSVSVVMSIIVLSIAACFLQTRRHYEPVFLANLGIGPLFIGLMFATPAVIGELIVYTCETVFP